MDMDKITPYEFEPRVLPHLPFHADRPCPLQKWDRNEDTTDVMCVVLVIDKTSDGRGAFETLGPKKIALNWQDDESALQKRVFDNINADVELLRTLHPSSQEWNVEVWALPHLSKTTKLYRWHSGYPMVARDWICQRYGKKEERELLYVEIDITDPKDMGERVGRDSSVPANDSRRRKLFHQVGDDDVDLHME